MLKLVRFDLRNAAEWDEFYNLFSAYLAEVCEDDEYQENIADLHDETLNSQMIEQTLQEHNPYFVMRIVLCGECVGLISYSYNEKCFLGFINNFYVCPEQRSTGIGSTVYRMVETHLSELGAKQVDLIPVGKAQPFYVRNGFVQTRTTVDGEQVFGKKIKECTMYIETPRMIIRDFMPEDALNLHDIFGDEETMENCEPAYDFEKTEKFLTSFCIERKGAVAAVHKESGKMMGYILFNEFAEGVYEMGWIFNRSFWRQGYTYESCKAVMDYAFTDMKAHKIFAEAIDV